MSDTSLPGIRISCGSRPLPAERPDRCVEITPDGHGEAELRHALLGPTPLTPFTVVDHTPHARWLGPLLLMLSLDEDLRGCVYSWQGCRTPYANDTSCLLSAIGASGLDPSDALDLLRDTDAIFN